jgi:hypothetical protein
MVEEDVGPLDFQVNSGCQPDDRNRTQDALVGQELSWSPEAPHDVGVTHENAQWRARRPDAARKETVGCGTAQALSGDGPNIVGPERTRSDVGGLG